MDAICIKDLKKDLKREMDDSRCASSPLSVKSNNPSV